MSLIATEINGKIYRIHPVIDLYGVSFDGEIPLVSRLVLHQENMWARKETVVRS